MYVPKCMPDLNLIRHPLIPRHVVFRGGQVVLSIDVDVDLAGSIFIIALVLVIFILFWRNRTVRSTLIFQLRESATGYSGKDNVECGKVGVVISELAMLLRVDVLIPVLATV